MTSTIVRSTTPGSNHVAIPRMTLEPGCLTDLYRLTTRCGFDQTLCTYFHIGKIDGEEGCLTDSSHPATTCPESYTSVGSHNSVNNADTTSVELYCCPSGYGFTWQDTSPTPTSASAKGPSLQRSCVATQPNLPGRGGPPWTVTATEPPGTAPSQTVLATVDPNSDVLVASPAIVQYEIAAGTTCAPNCSSPWPSADPSPFPEPPRPSFDGRNVGSIVAYVLAVVIPVVLFLCFCFCRWGGRPAAAQPPNTATRLVYKVRRAFMLCFRA